MVHSAEFLIPTWEIRVEFSAPGPALAFPGIWGVNQRSVSLSTHLLLSSFFCPASPKYICIYFVVIKMANLSYAYLTTTRKGKLQSLKSKGKCSLFVLENGSAAVQETGEGG